MTRVEAPRAAPDYTDAFLVSAAALVFVLLFALWAAAGILTVAALAALADMLTRRAARRGQAPEMTEAAASRPPEP